MGTFLVYILKSAVCLAMFYLFYRLLLSKETFHRFNRIALLGVMLLSCLLPLVKVTENIYSLELFHGPTLAFKDVGGRKGKRKCTSDVDGRLVADVPME